MSLSLVAVALLSAFLTFSNGFLTSYQNRLEDLHRQTIDLLSSSHATNSDLQKTLIERGVLVYLGNVTFQLQTVHRDVTYQMKDFRELTDADQSCLDTIDASIGDAVFAGQLWLQVCSQSMVFFLSRDAVLRFYPVANQVHRDSSEAARSVVDTLAEINALHEDGEAVRMRLNEVVDQFEQAWTRAQRELGEELDKHADMSEEVLREFHLCVEDLYFYYELQMYNLLWFARDTCL